jgi:integrase
MTADPYDRAGPSQAFVTAKGKKRWRHKRLVLEWTPRELRHSFVSLLSDAGVMVEQIAQLVGHAAGGRSRSARVRERPVWCTLSRGDCQAVRQAAGLALPKPQIRL